MANFMTEDEVRDSAKVILGFDKKENGVQQGTGQLTTFNQLGIAGQNNKPDGWYLPDNKNDVAIIYEAKNSNEDLGKKKWIDEVKENCRIVLDAGWLYVVGILHNGKKVIVFMNNKPIDAAKDLQDKQYYINLFSSKAIDKNRIYMLTARINNCLHSKFGIKNLYHRMIFTACALVAERYGAKLRNFIGLPYDSFKSAVKGRLQQSLDRDVQQNSKIHILIEVFDSIVMNNTENQDAIDSFIEWVVEISDCINSNKWRGEDVMGIFFNEFNRYKKKSEAGQVFTPDHICSFMYRLLDVHQNDNVGDFTCGSGAFLVKSMSNMIEEAGGVDTAKAKEIKKSHLYGIEFDREIYALACANMLIHKDGKTNLEQLDTRSQAACDWIKSKPITKVLMNPPYENKYGCIEIVENVLDSVRPGTDCAFILPDKKLEKVSRKAVERILSNHRLTTIVKFPEPLFFGVGVTTSLFVFKAGEPQNGKEIFGCYIEDDGLETVKNQGRHDVKGKWKEIEDYWIDSIKKLRDEKHGTAQWINPKEHLSYQMPEKPFELFEEDFVKTMMDYEMFKRGINVKEFGDKLLHRVLYDSDVSANDSAVTVSMKAVEQNG